MNKFHSYQKRDNQMRLKIEYWRMKNLINIIIFNINKIIGKDLEMNTNLK